MISAVKKRELNLLRKNYSPAPYGLNKMYESVLTKYNPKTAKTVLENWDHLAKDPNIAFTKAFFKYIFLLFKVISLLLFISFIKSSTL